MDTRPKPIVPFRSFLSLNPSKNYILNLLSHHIFDVSPGRSLDAGAGDLRNLWMFPGKYVGISRERATYFAGLERSPNPQIIQKRGMPEVYLMRLESDFSFVGEFDLAVCTFTMMYIEDRADLITRLSDRVRQGGALIIEGPVESVDAAIAVVGPRFEAIELIYFGLAECHRTVKDMGPEDITKLSRVEMKAPNRREGHSFFYCVARGKRLPAGPAGPVPELEKEGGLSMVKAEIPHLRLGEWPLPLK